jgi:hypothetical protein
MKDLNTWADLANNYSLVLFNQCAELGDGEVLQEWMDNHTCEAQTARLHLEDCEEENCKQCAQYINDYGEYPECQCEPMQWYAIAAGEFDAEHLNETYDLDIFYSDFLGIYILPVYHFGTSWTHVNLK